MILQKLLTGADAQAIAHGFDQVGGVVIDAAAATSLKTPAQLLAAYGYDEDPDGVTVVRFEIPKCSQLTAPDPTPRPWPTYPFGFLKAPDIIEAWNLSRTRYSPGATVWQIARDGQQQAVARYEGAARGWRGAKEWRQPSRLVGTRTNWQDAEYVADVHGAEVEITTFNMPPTPGWQQHRQQTWSRTVPIAECEIFELHVTATVGEVDVRVLANDGKTAHVLLLTADPEVAQRIGASATEPGVFEHPTVPANQLTNIRASARQAV